jgi:hypothetical protein
MTTPYTIPTTPGTAQTFNISLAGTVYNLTLNWNKFSQSWTLDIADDEDNDLVTGIPLVTGCDLLAQFPYLNFGGSLIVQGLQNPDTPPNLATLGTTSQLYFVTEP